MTPNYVGCYDMHFSPLKIRDLSLDHFTVATCQEDALMHPSGPFRYFAINSGALCTLGNTLPPRTTKGEYPTVYTCKPCTGPGESSLLCGNSNIAQSVYEVRRVYSPPPPPTCGWTYFGCFANDVSDQHPSTLTALY